MSRCREPTLKNRVRNRFAKFDDYSWKFVLMAVETEQFHGSSEGRYDELVVSRERQENSSENKGRSGKIKVWLEKALDSLRVVLKASENRLCPRHKKVVVRKMCLKLWEGALLYSMI